MQTLAAHKQIQTKTKPMSQLANIEQKEVIKSVTGKITKLWEPKEFTGPKGKFEIQGGEIEIDGQRYGLKFFENNQNASILEGKVVTISCSRGKHGFTGVTLDHESFSKKDGTKVDRDVIKVTKTGKVELGEADAIPMTHSTDTPKQTIGTDNSDKTLDDLVMQHLYVNDLVRAAYAKKGYDEETLRSYVASVFIEANRKGIHIGETKKEVEPTYDPADWASAIVPSGTNKGKTLASIGKPALKKLYAFYLEKGFNTPFAKCVEQAGIDLNIYEAGDDDLPDVEW
jgi:hypothetical protein